MLIHDIPANKFVKIEIFKLEIDSCIKINLLPQADF